MESFPKHRRLQHLAERIAGGSRWPALCVFAALLGSCGRLSLGGYDDAAPDGTGGNDGGSGYGNASAGASQSRSSAGAEQVGGWSARGGVSSTEEGGSAGTGHSNGGAQAGAGGEAEQGGSAGEAGSGGAWTDRPSCRELPATCGALGDEDCCTSLDVPKGQFVLGATSVESAKASVSEFGLDKYEVTVGRFRNFLSHYDEWRAARNPAPGVGANPHVEGSGWQSAWDAELAPSASELEARIVDCNGLPFSALRMVEPIEELPLQAINCVNWYEASAFCAWDGARLPTELEWEYAATGGDRLWPYPWGTVEPSPAYANHACYFNLEGKQYNPARPPCEFPVGVRTLGMGRWGHLDLAGSMAEWVFDGPRSYPSLCHDCAYGGAGLLRGLRGGGWSEPPEYLSTTGRRFMEAKRRIFFEGVRCATSRSAPCAGSCDPNATCSDTDSKLTCTCREGFIGDGHSCARPSSCAELHRAWPHLASGRYVLAANDGKSASEFTVSCEMSVDGGGWTLVLNQDETFDPAAFGDDFCTHGRCTSLAYSRVQLERDLLLDFNSGPILADQYSARALIRGVHPAALGKTVRELFTSDQFFIEREDNSNVSVSVPSQVPCSESLPPDMAALLCQTCATGQSCTAPVMVFGDGDPGCTTDPFRFAIGGAHSYGEPWDNCAGWPQAPDYGEGDYYPKNVRIWVR
jgi:formylglycine-generating enzyme